ncbi:MAG TPA: ABC transporter ATP-binding protein, partial [Euzebya sp.]|nr:ABC transporter ATP-binding protein [Euzebya sp.]
MLHVSGLTKRYGQTTVLNAVDLQVARGEIVGLIGPNGAGKTTLVSIVAGLVRPDEGTIAIGGVDPQRTPLRARRLIGLAPQDLGVYPTATVAENLHLFAGLAGLRRGEAKRHIAELAQVLGLAALLQQRVQTLSGGQKRRLHTAAALLHRPPLALLDEPTVGADVETRAMLLRVVRDLADEGTAVVYTTHYLHELEHLGATIAVLEQGRVVARGTQA